MFSEEKQKFFLEHRDEHVLFCFIVISEHVLNLKIKKKLKMDFGSEDFNVSDWINLNMEKMMTEKGYDELLFTR